MVRDMTLWSYCDSWYDHDFDLEHAAESLEQAAEKDGLRVHAEAPAASVMAPF
jgi:hypothetical protein